MAGAGRRHQRRLPRRDHNGPVAASSHVGPFVVDNELGDQADILCKLSDMTWRAYNTFGTFNDPTGGKSVYGQGSGNFSQGGRAWDVTYDTPLMVNAGVAQTSYWNGERPLHYWLGTERLQRPLRHVVSTSTVTRPACSVTR